MLCNCDAGEDMMSLGYKEIKPVSPKGNQPWIFIGRTDAEAPILWPADVKSQLIWKDPDAGKDWRQEKGMAENVMVRWHHQLTGHEFEQTLGDSGGQGSLHAAVHGVTNVISGSFPVSQFSTSAGQSIGASASFLPMNIQDWFPLGFTGLISLLSKGLSRIFSSPTVQKHQFFSAQLSL